MASLEGKDRVSVILDVPDDIRMNLRKGVFMVMEELALGSPDSPIPVLHRDLEKVIAYVKSQIPDVEVIDGDGTKIFRKKAEPIAIPISELSADDEGEWSNADEIEGLYGHHRRWGEINDHIRKARKLVSPINKPAGRKWSKFLIYVNESGFSYRGELLSLVEPGSAKLRTAKELRAWKAEVNKMKDKKNKEK